MRAKVGQYNEFFVETTSQAGVLLALEQRVLDIRSLVSSLYLVFAVGMAIMVLVGFYMREMATVKRIHRKTTLYHKNLIILAVSGLTVTIIGFGICREAQGGLLGHKHVFGQDLEEHQILFCYIIVLGAMMSTIASSALAERASMATHLFFCFVNNCFLFPIAFAWV